MTAYTTGMRVETVVEMTECSILVEGTLSMPKTFGAVKTWVINADIIAGRDRAGRFPVPYLIFEKHITRSLTA